MRGRITLGVSMLALLVGFGTAPYTHAHPMGHSGPVGEGHHRREATRHAHLPLHATAADHAHESPDAPDDDDHDAPSSDVVAADDFVFQTAGGAAWQMPAVLTVVVAIADRTSVWLGVSLPGPPVHGPPSSSPSAPRAPPVLPPAAF